MEEPPKAVPVTANQFGYDPLRWAWAEPAVWTERMLTALEQGVKGNRWFSLIDKVYSPRCLTAAAFQVEANEGAAGVDHVSVTGGKRKWPNSPSNCRREPIDSWMRQRLRSILRRRTHRCGRARGREQFRWPNAYFAKQGLFSLVATPAQVVPSSPR